MMSGDASDILDPRHYDVHFTNEITVKEDNNCTSVLHPA